MYPSDFEYHAPETIDEVFELIKRHGSTAKVLAGGHSLVPMMKLRLAKIEHLVDLKKLRPSLSYIREENGDIAIGALTSHSDLELSQLLREKALPLAEAAGVIGDVQVRNMGTLGGSLSHADPAADQPAPALALEVKIVAQDSSGKRIIPAGQFFSGFFSTALRTEELLVEVRVPVLDTNAGAAYLKYPHPASGYAVCGVAAVLITNDEGECTTCRVGITGIADGAYRASNVELAMEGHSITANLIEKASESATDNVEPLEDNFAGVEYRRVLACAFVKRTLIKAWKRSSSS